MTNTDKRSVSTDALATLGTIIKDGGRDAIHLAVEPIIAGESLMPGSNIGISGGKAYIAGDGIKALGIADPFLQSMINQGEKFWLIVYPRQITSLRHVWEHPDFESKVLEPKKDTQYSEQWLRNWCNNTDDAPTYEDLIGVMTDGEVSESEGYGQRWSNEGDYLLSRGCDASGEIPLEVWIHVEAVTGRKLSSYPSYFSCTC